jgi:hypothetical protein
VEKQSVRQLRALLKRKQLQAGPLPMMEAQRFEPAALAQATTKIRIVSLCQVMRKKTICAMSGKKQVGKSFLLKKAKRQEWRRRQ